MSISDRLTKLTTDITNAYTSIENKGGTIPANKNTNNLPTAIDSIEVIEQATAEGESINLANTKAMPYSDYVVKGKSEQATRSGKNLLNNIATSQTLNGVTFTVNKDKSVLVNGTSTSEFSFVLGTANLTNRTYYKVTGCPSGGSSSSYRLWCNNVGGDTGEGFVGPSYETGEQNVFINLKNGAVLNNLLFKPMVRLASITDDTYEPYGASPSPDYPSEIHSVADDVNLFDINSTVGGNANFTKTIENNHLTLTATGTIGAQFVGNYVKNVDSSKKYTLSFKAKKTVKGTDGEPVIEIIVYGSNDDTNYTLLELSKQNPVEGQEYSFNKTVTGYNYYRFFIYNNASTPVTVGEKTEYWDIKFQEGSVATPYSPYNQGTVTIKQETVKNYLDWNKFIDYSNWSNADSDGYKSFEISGLDANKIYTLCRVDTEGYGEELKFAGFNNNKDNGNIFLHSTDNSRNLKNISSFPTQDGKIYINMFMNSQNDLNDYISIIKKCWVIEGTDYEPYQGNKYTIQTEPLRSLPNGVKDTIEADGIHRKVGRVVLNGSENWYLGQYPADNSYQFMTNKPSNMFTDTGTSVMNKLLSTYFKNEFGTNGMLVGSLLSFYPSTDLNISTPNEFKTWLSTHNTEVLYELAEEIIESLTQNQATTMLDIIKTGSYEGTTNIYTDKDVKPTIGVEYYKKS